jgi:hypothetical protein
MGRAALALVTGLIVAILPTPVFASPIFLDFETMSDSEIVTTQFPGLTFSNATILTAGTSLNEFEFPPHSGSNVVFDDGGPLSITFASPIFGFSGFFNYSTALQIVAFDSSHHTLGSASSLFNSNLALSGDPGSSSNEFLQLALADIASVSITGDSLGGSFTLDDVSVNEASEVTPVPEPGTFSLIGLGLVSLVRKRRRIE